VIRTKSFEKWIFYWIFSTYTPLRQLYYKGSGMWRRRSAGSANDGRSG